MSKYRLNSPSSQHATVTFVKEIKETEKEKEVA